MLPLEDGELNDSVVDGNDILEAELCDSCEEDEDYVQGDVTSDESVEDHLAPHYDQSDKNGQ